MPAPTNPNPKIYGYHAHVYYDALTKPVAERFHPLLSAAYPVEMGQFSGERVGPHPVPQFQIIFTKDEFAAVVQDDEIVKVEQIERRQTEDRRQCGFVKTSVLDQRVFRIYRTQAHVHGDYRAAEKQHRFAQQQ